MHFLPHFANIFGCLDYSTSLIKGSLGKKKLGVYRLFFGLLYSPCPSYSVDMISVCFQIFVPNVNRSQIDEMYNKTNIAKLEKLCSRVRTLMSSLISISQAATKPVTEGIHLQEKSPAFDILSGSK